MQNDKKVIQIPVTWRPARRKADDSVDLCFNTNVEIPTEEMAIFDGLRKSSGWLLYAENEFDPKDVPSEPAVDNGKSPSKRLRAVMFLAYKEKYPEGKEFDNWYSNQMETIIDRYKDILE